MLKKVCGATLAAGAFATLALAAVDSGLKAGEMVTPFHPRHVTGPNKGTSACPPCTYGNRPQVQVWINRDDAENVTAIGKLLNDAVLANKDSQLKGFMIFLVDQENPGIQAKLTKLSEKTGQDIALAYLTTGDEAVDAYKINTSAEVKNTIMVYRNKKVTQTFVNLKADEKGKAALASAISSVVN